LYLHKSLNGTINTQATTQLPSFEGLFVDITQGSKTVTVGVIYRPPNSNYKDFLTEFQKTVKLLPKTKTFLMGDFNIDLLKTTPTVEKFENMFVSEGLFPLILLYLLPHTAQHRQNHQPASTTSSQMTLF
jgi:hypothetical protein